MISQNIINAVPNTAAAMTNGVVGSTAQTLAAIGFVLAADTEFVDVSVETNSIRICPNGTTPTSSLGHLVTPGQTVRLSRAEADVAKFIRASSPDATIQLSQSK